MAAVTMQLCAAPTGVASSSSRTASSRSIAPLRCFTAAVRGQAVYQKAELRAAARQSVVARAAFAGEPCGWNVHDCAGCMAVCLVVGRGECQGAAAAAPQGSHQGPLTCCLHAPARMHCSGG